MVTKSVESKLGVKGVYFDIELRDETGKVVFKGKKKCNTVPTQGLNNILNVWLGNGTQTTTWYLAPYNNAYTPQLTDTGSNIVANAGESTSYDEGTRVAYVPAAASGGSITNSASRAEFTFNATETINGFFLVSTSAKSNTTGTLASAAKLTSGIDVQAGWQLLVGYALTLANA